MKKLILLLNLLLIIQNQNLSQTKNQNQISVKRNLEIGTIIWDFATGFGNTKSSVTYNKPTDLLTNSYTGTGFQLKDVVYKSICKSLNCESSCCNGEMDKIQCATGGQCAVYYFRYLISKVLAGVLLYIGLCFLIALFITSKIDLQDQNCCCTLMTIFLYITFFLVILIIFIFKSWLKKCGCNCKCFNFVDRFKKKCSSTNNTAVPHDLENNKNRPTVNNVKITNPFTIDHELHK